MSKRSGEQDHVAMIDAQRLRFVFQEQVALALGNQVEHGLRLEASRERPCAAAELTVK